MRPSSVGENPRWRPERQVELMWCDGGMESLMANFLKGFTIDGLEKPWQAMAASWNKSFMSKVFGVPAYYLYGNNNFLLVCIYHLSVSAVFITARTRLGSKQL